MFNREIVKRAIEFDKPERIPLIFPFLGISDVYFIPLKNPAFLENESRHKPEREDEWGSVKEKNYSNFSALRNEIFYKAGNFISGSKLGMGNFKVEKFCNICLHSHL